MPKIVILPHEELCPEGAVFETETGVTVLDVALANGVEIEHACEKVLRLYHLSCGGSRGLRQYGRAR